MDFVTQVLHLVGSSAVAYISALNLRDVQSRPNVLAGFQMAESGSVPFLEALSRRAASEGDEWLAERLARHADDERRHGQIFAHALKQMNKQVIDFSQLPKTDEGGKEDDRRRSPFFEAYFKDYSREQLSPEAIDWSVFFASTYILELDASKDFARMARALPEEDANSRNLKHGILSIAADETGHAAYLKEAMERRMTAIEVERTIDHWRTRKVNAMMAMVGNFLQKGGKMSSLARDGVPTEMAETAKSEAVAASV